MQRILVLCFLVLLLPLAVMADPQAAPTVPSQIVAPAAPAAPVCLDEILSAAPDQGFTPNPTWLSFCCDVDADCAGLHCITGRHPACGGANTGCGRCNCVNN